MEYFSVFSLSTLTCLSSKHSGIYPNFIFSLDSITWKGIGVVVKKRYVDNKTCMLGCGVVSGDGAGEVK